MSAHQCQMLIESLHQLGKVDLDFLFKADTSYLPELEELVLAKQTLTVWDIKACLRPYILKSFCILRNLHRTTLS